MPLIIISTNSYEVAEGALRRGFYVGTIAGDLVENCDAFDVALGNKRQGNNTLRFRAD